MKVAELITNNNFDVNCNYSIYECPKEGTCWYHGGIRIFSTIQDPEPPKDHILQKEISYITINNNFLVIEVK